MGTENAENPANITQTDANGTFSFNNLSPGVYNLTAHRLILGAMHYMGKVSVTVPGNESNTTIKVSRADDAQFAAFKNASVNLTPGNQSITGLVLGANRPGAEPKEIPYEDTLVKITAAE
ncbi:MAG: carboxypeptidase-like regulatory domain-containing protein [Methanothrix sp.]|nr:carboxypeptidase-like regulatory domain-containing protein [Methanothrix sp.]